MQSGHKFCRFLVVILVMIMLCVGDVLSMFYPRIVQKQKGINMRNVLHPF